ncbi:DUF7619 domain-containing protein, partial [Flavobacterium humi]
MKKLYFLLLAIGFFTGAEAQIINFPDDNFKQVLLRPNQYQFAVNPVTGMPYQVNIPVARNISGSPILIDQNNDGQIQVAEAQNVYSLSLDNFAGLPYEFFGMTVNISNLSGIEYFTNLQSLNCSENDLTSLPVSPLINLKYLSCGENHLTSLSLSSLVNLQYLDCRSNNFTSVNPNQNPTLKYLDCSFNPLTSLNVTQNLALETLECTNNQLVSLDVIQNSALLKLNCTGNQLTNLNVTQNPSLVYLYCANNQLASLDLTQNHALVQFWCENNQFTSLNVTQNFTLEELLCANNQLTSLNVAQNSNLVSLNFDNNQLTSLNVAQNPKLMVLSFDNNQLVSIDLSQNPLLSFLYCDNNSQLKNIFIKNAKNEDTFNFNNCPNLTYICADESQLTSIQNAITQYGYTNCHVNSYCSFVPGGQFYTIQGNQKFDANNNGCDVADTSLPNLKFNITDGTNSGSLISNAVGNYSIPVLAGTHTITPVFENASYFNASPSTVNVTFPTQASPFIQNFCITVNGIHPDLEVSILPLVPARPGFDATYKLVYKNKGNTTQSGTVNVTFNDAALDLVTSNPVATASTNSLSWAFTNLVPFETREIAFTLNVNSPMETPAVNGGDILHYTASITSVATDELPNDNTFELNQTVVNSFDPNDKTCLEGATIAPGKVGEYVHYMIRFENTGTFPAQNIVVKDMIDTAKFDISSLVPMKASHSFTTRITEGNKVEFIFENINLPFDDANNDGYVAFKVKTKPTLVSGNTFSNTASIYFDYNFPIVTNTATTTIAALGVQDFEFSNYFNVYPNPVHDVLTISAKETIEISSI